MFVKVAIADNSFSISIYVEENTKNVDLSEKLISLALILQYVSSRPFPTKSRNTRRLRRRKGYKDAQ